MKCPAHPYYKVERRPTSRRADCVCLAIWNRKQVWDNLYAMYCDHVKYPQLRLPDMQAERLKRVINLLT